jgi:hypothetical protein
MKLLVSEHAGKRRKLTSRPELRRLLIQLQHDSDPNVELLNEQGDFLAISIKSGLCLVRFTQASLDPPYFSASNGEVEAEGEYFEFVVGATATPVPTNRCIPLETAISLAEHFFDCGGIPSSVKWEKD